MAAALHPGAFAPGVQSAALSVARGNGKTALLSGIAAATLDGPLAVPRGETVIVASSSSKPESPSSMSSHSWPKSWKIARAGKYGIPRNKQELRTARQAHGCAASAPIRAGRMVWRQSWCWPNEPAQWPETTGERMVSALRTAAGKQPHSRFVAIGTRPADAEHWFSKMLAGSADYAQCHAARASDPPFQRRTWAKANPSLPAMPDLLAAIVNEARQARQDPALLASFEALRLNLGTEDAAVSTPLDAGLWQAIEASRRGPGRAFGASIWERVRPQSAVACYHPQTGALASLAAFPAEPSLPSADSAMASESLR